MLDLDISTEVDFTTIDTSHELKILIGQQTFQATRSDSDPVRLYATRSSCYRI